MNFTDTFLEKGMSEMGSESNFTILKKTTNLKGHKDPFIALCVCGFKWEAVSSNNTVNGSWNLK